MTKYGYLKEDTVYRLDQYCVSLDHLYDNKLEEAARWISPVHQDELKKFLSYVPNLDIKVDY